MRPDEEYEDAEDAPTGVNSRAMSWMVLAVAVGGFAALAYYAYHSGAQPAKEGDAMVVEADGAPIKSAPETADGEQFANKDKTIYDVIAPDGTATTEKLMPEPERPVAAANVEDSEDNVPVATPSQEAVAAVAKPEAKPAAPASVSASAPAPASKTTSFVAADAKSVTTETAPNTAVKPAPEKVEAAKPVEKSFESPQMINEKKPVAKVEPKASTKTAGGSYMIQLGAFKSEAEAKASWNKISSKFTLTSAPTIVKAEVNGGTFYRLRTGSYASSADAKAACAKLAGQACMPVK